MPSNPTFLMAGVFGLFFLMLFLPAIPMIQAIRNRKDVEPLGMDMDFVFNPRFQAIHFENLLKNAARDFNVIPLEERLDTSMVPMLSRKPLLFRTKGDITVDGTIDSKAILDAGGAIKFHPNARIHALKSKEHISIGEESMVDLWIDSGAEVIVHKNARTNLITAKTVKLYKGSSFKRIFAGTIGFYPLNKEGENKIGEDIVHTKESLNVEAQALYLDKNETIKADSSIHSDVIGRGDLRIEKGCSIYGSLKANGNLEIENNVHIYGNIFCDHDITIKHHCFVFGNIFSHTYIRIGHNTQIGKYAAPKSIIGIKGIEIAGGTFVHNYILTYGEGRVV